MESAPEALRELMAILEAIVLRGIRERASADLLFVVVAVVSGALRLSRANNVGFHVPVLHEATVGPHVASPLSV